MLPGTVTGVPKQEAAAAEIAEGNDRIMIHEYNNRTNSIGLASPGGVITNNTSANASMHRRHIIILQIIRAHHHRRVRV